MTGIRMFMLMIMLITPLLAGCMEEEGVDGSDDIRLENIEKVQKDILAKMDSIEANQKEMVKLFKAGNRAQPAKPSIDYNKVNNIPIADSHVRGNPKAPITIVEFSDFQCPYCSKLQPTLEQVLKEYPDKVKLVFKDYPLSFHKEAKPAAKAALAAGEQGKYWEMHDLIFKDFNKLNEAKFKEFAGQLGLDMEKFMKDSKSNKYDARIQRDSSLGVSIGVRGTPSLFMNGKRMGARSFDAFKALIKEYSKK